MTQTVDVSAWGTETHTPYAAADDRYSRFGYRRVGRSGLLLPPISLGLWWNFGDTTPCLLYTSPSPRDRG